MITNNQLKAVQLKAKIVSDLLLNNVLNIEDIQELFDAENVLSESAKIDELFKMIVDTVKGSDCNIVDTNIQDIFKQLCPEDNDYSDFLFNFMNFLINDSANTEIQVRLNQLKNLNFVNVPDGCEVYKLYLYNVLTLALVCHPLDLNFIRETNEELIRINNENNN